jgi:hypothetical protein
LREAPRKPKRRRCPAAGVSLAEYCVIRPGPWLVLLVALAAPAAPFPSYKAAAQAPEQARIVVPRAIVARAPSEAALGIAVGPPAAVPARSFVSLRGMPPAVALTEGHRVGPGLWAIPLSALPKLRARIPAAVSGRIELVIRLIGRDGRLLAEASTALIVEPGAARPPHPVAPTAPRRSPTALASR